MTPSRRPRRSRMMSPSAPVRREGHLALTEGDDLPFVLSREFFVDLAGNLRRRTIRSAPFDLLTVEKVV